ncbi:Myosin IJ heavy chain, putative, partial [Eimeria necatrix]
MEQHEASQRQEGNFVGTAGGGQFSSITKRFLKSVKDLNQELQGPHMQLHFIRCFIPNCEMKPDAFERKIVLQQLQHSGSLALVDILQSGFPHRMPLHSLAAKLRAALCPLLKKRLEEQEQKVQKLMEAENKNVPLNFGVLPSAEETARQRRLLETLRHWDPNASRDRTLASATLGLLPQCRPGAFICGVSLVCFKASAYGEAAALIADPAQFFKTPEDLCRLITAIQRLRWRVAVRTILHVHPKLLWLQRRAFLMRKIKQEAATAALRVILLRKHILIPLRERAQRRLSIRQGVISLEHILLRRGLQSWRSYRQALAAADSAKKSAACQPRANEEAKCSKSSSVPEQKLCGGQGEASGAAGDEHQQLHFIPSWNARLFPVGDHRQNVITEEHEVAVYPGRDLYFTRISGVPPVEPGKPAPEKKRLQQPPQNSYLSANSPSGQEQTHEISDISAERIVGGEGYSDPTVQLVSTEAPILTIAKHPFYTNLFIASNSAAHLLLLLSPRTANSEMKEEETTITDCEGSVPSRTAPLGEPSTILPRLDCPSSLPCSSKGLPSSNDASADASHRPVRMLRNFAPGLSNLSNLLPGSDGSASAFPERLLPTDAIPPGKWLPRDLLDRIRESSQDQLSHTRHPRPPTVRPLSVSFASPITADYAIVVCLVQGKSSKNNNNNSSSTGIGSLTLVLVDLLRREPAGWIPLSFASHDLSICARRNSACLQQLSQTAFPGSNTNAGKIKNAAAELRAARNPLLTARTRSTMLSTIRLQPLWGNVWAVTGPSLLAIFSINL